MTYYQDDLFAKAREKRDEGMERVERNAGPMFSENAQRFIVDYLSRHPPTSCEIIVNACKDAGIRPHNDHAFGPVFLKLFKDGRIRKAGMTKRFKGHAAPGANIWGINHEIA
jgi:hypothetical protein